MNVINKALLLLAVCSHPAVVVPVVPCVLNCLFDSGCCDTEPSTPTCSAIGGVSCNETCRNDNGFCVSDTSSNSLGVRFTTDEDICVIGIQFYHVNNGTYNTALWNNSNSAEPLATASVTDESTGGWYTATFASPVTMSAGDIYVASYTAPNGAYAFQYKYFDIDRVVPPVTFPGGGVFGIDNGVFGAPYLFPALGPFKNSSYFVSPLWVAQSLSYYIYNSTSDAVVEPLYDGWSGCVKMPYNIEVRPCVDPFGNLTVAMKLSNVTVVHRQFEIEKKYFLWGNVGPDVKANNKNKPLVNGPYRLSTTITYGDGSNETETINFTQSC